MAVLPFLLPWAAPSPADPPPAHNAVGSERLADGEGARAGAQTPPRAVARAVVELTYRSLLVAVAAALVALGGPTSVHAQTVRVGPSYLYPTVATPGVVNPDVTQTNINDTICKSGWTDTIRPPTSFTNALKKQQLIDLKRKDKTPSHYEEDHFISLELGGHPRDPKNLWPEMWGTPATPLTSDGPFPSHLVGAKTKDHVENALHNSVCDGSLTLEEAQDIIVTDWFKYYRDTLLK